MTSRTLKTLAILAITSLIAACGGGGGGGNDAPATTATDPNKEFSLSTFKSTNLGTVYSTQLSGSDSDGGQWTGSLSIANRSQTMVDGVLVTPQDSLLSLTLGGSSFASGGTTYIDASGYILGDISQDGTVCTPAFPYQLPDVVKIGDFGLLPTETCSDFTVTESSWRVEDAGNGFINFIFSEDDNEGFTGVETYRLNSAGDILAFKGVVAGPGIPTITLNSK